MVELKNSNDVDLFTISSSDKFGVDGVVGFIVCKKKKDNIDIDTFLLSCRVMGRKLEYVVISSLCYYYKNVAKTISGKYIKTSKNTPVSNLYDELGFKLIKSSNEEKDYIYELFSC